MKEPINNNPKHHCQIDYELFYHYEFNDNGDIINTGYTVKFFTAKVIKYVKKHYNIIAKKMVRYRFTDTELVMSLRDDLCATGNGFVGVLGDDGWPLYALKFEWYTAEELEDRGDTPYGKELWDSIPDLVVSAPEMILNPELDAIIDRVLKLQDKYYDIPYHPFGETEMRFIKKHWNDNDILKK